MLMGQLNLMLPPVLADNTPKHDAPPIIEDVRCLSPIDHCILHRTKAAEALQRITDDGFGLCRAHVHVVELAAWLYGEYGTVLPHRLFAVLCLKSFFKMDVGTSTQTRPSCSSRRLRFRLNKVCAQERPNLFKL